MPIPNFLDQNLTNGKSYPPYLNGFQVKTTQKWYCPILSRIEFGSEWQPCLLVLLQLLGMGPDDSLKTID